MFFTSPNTDYASWSKINIYALCQGKLLPCPRCPLSCLASWSPRLLIIRSSGILSQNDATIISVVMHKLQLHRASTVPVQSCRLPSRFDMLLHCSSALRLRMRLNDSELQQSWPLLKGTKNCIWSISNHQLIEPHRKNRTLVRKIKLLLSWKSETSNCRVFSQIRKCPLTPLLCPLHRTFPAAALLQW